MIYKHGQHSESERFGDVLSGSFWNFSVSDAVNSILLSVYVSGALLKVFCKSLPWILIRVLEVGFTVSTRLREGR